MFGKQLCYHTLPQNWSYFSEGKRYNYEWNIRWMWGECVHVMYVCTLEQGKYWLNFVTLNAIFNKQIIILVQNIRQLLLEHIHQLVSFLLIYLIYQLLPYSGKFSRDKISADGSKNENSRMLARVTRQNSENA